MESTAAWPIQNAWNYNLKELHCNYPEKKQFLKRK